MPPKLTSAQIDAKLEELHGFVCEHVSLLASRSGSSLLNSLRQNASKDERKWYLFLKKNVGAFTEAHNIRVVEMYGLVSARMPEGEVVDTRRPGESDAVEKHRLAEREGSGIHCLAEGEGTDTHRLAEANGSGKHRLAERVGSGTDCLPEGEATDTHCLAEGGGKPLKHKRQNPSSGSQPGPKVQRRM